MEVITPAQIVILSGSPGTGKTSLSKLLAENTAYDRAVHIHTDDFYQYIRRGYRSPWMDGTASQNETVIEAAAASAKSFYNGGYEVYVDGVIGPWFLDPWLQIVGDDIDVRYIVLRPEEQVTVVRAAEREQRAYFPLSSTVVEEMWQAFSDLGEYEPHIVNTSLQTVQESAALLQKRLREGAFRLGS